MHHLVTTISAFTRRQKTAVKPVYAGLTVISAILLSGCAATAPEQAIANSNAGIATQWHVNQPHNGQLTELKQWWAQFNDPLLLRLLASAQHASPTLAQATANIADARAALVSSKARLLPAVDASVSAGRSRADLVTPIANQTAVGLQASWELDIFGANRAAADATLATLESSQANWHEARILVAAEVATTYTALRACEAQAEQYQLDAQSRITTSAITSQSVNAGFQPSAAADLARASAAQGRMVLIQQVAQCDLLIKALTALTAQDEMALRDELAAGKAILPHVAGLTVSAIPADVLAQRPDIYAASRAVVAASAESHQAQAQRWPRITLTGNISASSMKSGGLSTDGTTWSIGPVAITLPLFDAGSRRASAEAARIRYDAAITIYAARLREAIQEVESALVTLNSTAASSIAANTAAEGFELSFLATESRYQAGLASLFDLEDARRSMINAKNTTIELQRERIASWITLYRAIGGGWSPAELHQPVTGHPAEPY